MLLPGVNEQFLCPLRGAEATSLVAVCDFDVNQTGTQDETLSGWTPWDGVFDAVSMDDLF